MNPTIPIKYIISSDGHIIINPDYIAWQNSHGGGTPNEIVGDAISQAVKTSITDPVDQFLSKNTVNLIVGFLGIFLVLIGVVELGFSK